MFLKKTESSQQNTIFVFKYKRPMIRNDSNNIWLLDGDPSRPNFIENFLIKLT